MLYKCIIFVNRIPGGWLWHIMVLREEKFRGNKRSAVRFYLRNETNDEIVCFILNTTAGGKCGANFPNPNEKRKRKYEKPFIETIRY